MKTMKTMTTMRRAFCTVTLGCAATLSTMPLRAEVTDMDKSFLTMAAQSDQNEIALSTLAETKATDPQVKSFARKMVTDHTMLTSKMKPFADAWNITPPTGPDSEHQAKLDKLNGLSGADFDKEYMQDMDADHHKALDAFTSEASSTTDKKFKATVVKGKGVVATHTAMADKMTNMSGSTSM